MAFGFSAISKKCVETAIPYTTPVLPQRSGGGGGGGGGGRVTHCNRLHEEPLPIKGTFYRMDAYKRVGISRSEGKRDLKKKDSLSTVDM